MNLQKSKTRTKATTIIVGTGLALGLLFQNCSKITTSDIETPHTSDTAGAAGVLDTPANPVIQPTPANSTTDTTPSIEIRASATSVIEGQQSILTVLLQNIDTAKYSCTDRLTQQVVASGDLLHSQQDIPITVEHDLECVVTGSAKSLEEPITATQNLTLNCANRIKNSNDNKCQDFKCEEVIELASKNDLLKIEARDSRGLCYAIKILSGIANSPSSLTQEIDQEVVSRNHDSGSKNHHPYNMGSIKTEFRLEGQRVVKLSGGLSDQAPILVDNFVLIGVHPADQDVGANLTSAYSALGTADATTIDESGTDSKSIEFNNVLIPLKIFGTGGTSTLSAVDITRSAEPEVIHSLDFRALDCGGSRELSDVYLLFQ